MVKPTAPAYARPSASIFCPRGARFDRAVPRRGLRRARLSPVLRAPPAERARARRRGGRRGRRVPAVDVHPDPATDGVQMTDCCDDDRAFWEGRLAEKKTALAAYDGAITALAGGAQSYSLDTGQTRQVVTKANLTEMRNMSRI